MLLSSMCHLFFIFFIFIFKKMSLKHTKQKHFISTIMNLFHFMEKERLLQLYIICILFVFMWSKIWKSFKIKIQVHVLYSSTLSTGTSFWCLPVSYIFIVNYNWLLGRHMLIYALIVSICRKDLLTTSSVWRC